MNFRLGLLITSCCFAFAGLSLAQLNNSEITQSFITIKNTFESAGPLSADDLPVQSEWFCDKYTLDYQEKTLAYSARDFQDQDSWLIQKKIEHPNATFFKINGEVFEMTSEGLQSGGMVSSLFRKTQEGQILVRTTEFSVDNKKQTRVSYGTCLKH